MIFETNRLLIRTLEAGDADNYFRLHGDPEVMKFIRAASTREQCDASLLEHIELNKKLDPYGRWLAFDKITGEFVGSFVVIPIVNTDLMQLGYSLLEKNWGRGYATEMIHGGLKYLSEKTPLQVIYAIAEEGNVGSKKALQKAGFKEDIILVEGEKKLIRYVIHDL